MIQDELYHYGVKGMKWGVRRYQNKDGSLTAEGKKHVSNFKKYQSLSKKADQESTRLIKSDKRLQRDFGAGADDDEFLEYVARTKYGIDTTSFWNSVVDRKNFYAQNSKSIKTGSKIVAKYSSKKVKK